MKKTLSINRLKQARAKVTVSTSEVRVLYNQTTDHERRAKLREVIESGVEAEKSVQRFLDGVLDRV